MSAPTSRDPLFVNTAGGQCWKRQHVDRDGRGLYALAALGLAPGYPESLASRQAASRLVLLQQIRASVDAELGGAR